VSVNRAALNCARSQASQRVGVSARVSGDGVARASAGGRGKFENDGREYFFNSATGESAWQRPPGFMTPRAGQDVATSAGVNGWEQHWDEDGRQYYYYNSATGESSFERPREFFTPREGQLAVVSAGSWGKYYDEGSGQSYYHNAEVRGSPVPTRLLRCPAPTLARFACS
jgi:hypothetical protein